MGSAMENHKVHQQTISHPHLSNHLEGVQMEAFPANLTPAELPVTGKNSTESLVLGEYCNQVNNSPDLIRLIPMFPVPPSSKMAELNLNHTANTEQPPAKHSSAVFQEMSAGFCSSSSSSGDSIISVAWYVVYVLKWPVGYGCKEGSFSNETLGMIRNYYVMG